MKSIQISALAVAAFCLAAGYLFLRNSFLNFSGDPDNLSETVRWENLIGEMRASLGDRFMDEKIEERSPLMVFKEADITGDGIPEALIDLGAGGAYTSFMTLMRLEEGRPVPANFAEEGKIGPMIFGSGASVRNGESVELYSEKTALYSGSWSTDNEGDIETCELRAYVWNGIRKHFEFSSRISREIQSDFCARVK